MFIHLQKAKIAAYIFIGIDIVGNIDEVNANDDNDAVNKDVNDDNNDANDDGTDDDIHEEYDEFEEVKEIPTKKEIEDFVRKDDNSNEANSPDDVTGGDELAEIQVNDEKENINFESHGTLINLLKIF